MRLTILRLGPCCFSMIAGLQRYGVRRTFYNQHTLSSSVVSIAVNDLIHHPAVEWDDIDSINAKKSNARKKLKPIHSSLFHTTTIFDRFAKVVCNTGVMPKKELFETWAAALYIDHHFSMNRRIADIAAGHGLLAWSLLLLDDERRKDLPEQTNNPSPRTVVCIDRRLPPSAEILQHAILQQWPELASRFAFVEGELHQIEPHSSCVLVSVHACGSLSDAMVRIAIEANAPIALVPCCHSRKKIMDFSPLAQLEYDRIFTASDDELDLVQALDSARYTALQRANYNVDIQYLPTIFTAKNKMILGTPSNLPPSSSEKIDTIIPSLRSSHRLKLPMIAHNSITTTSIDFNMSNQLSVNQHNNIHAKNLPLVISCADTMEARTKVLEMSGKANSNQRKFDQLLSTYATLDLSLWLPPHIDITATSLSSLLCQIIDSSSLSIYPMSVTLIDEYTEQTHTARKSRTFRIQYSNTASSTTAITTAAVNSAVSSTGMNNTTNFSPTIAATVAASVTTMTSTTADVTPATPTTELILRDAAWKVHMTLYHCIPIAFPGAQCR